MHSKIIAVMIILINRVVVLYNITAWQNYCYNDDNLNKYRCSVQYYCMHTQSSRTPGIYRDDMLYNRENYICNNDNCNKYSDHNSLIVPIFICTASLCTAKLLL